MILSINETDPLGNTGFIFVGIHCPPQSLHIRYFRICLPIPYLFPDIGECTRESNDAKLTKHTNKNNSESNIFAKLYLLFV